MLRTSVRAIAVTVSLAVMASCSHPDDSVRSVEARIATGAGPVVLHVAIADTDRTRERGLQGVTNLAPDAGMAFLFDGPTDAGFWMKDTPTPLSIAFWGSDGRLVAIMDMPPCAADPCPTYRPDSAFVGAVEAHRGFFAGHGVWVGDRVAIER